MNRKPVVLAAWLSALAIALVAVVLAALYFGPVKIGWEHFIDLMARRLTGGGFDSDDGAAVILFQIRAPRVWTGFVVGVGLAVAGCAFQGILRNPLADPFVLGVSTGAGLGASLSILFGAGLLFGRLSATPVFALAGALAAMALVYRLAVVNARLSVFNLIICGAIVNAFGSALILYIMAISSRELAAIFFWLNGRLSASDWPLTRFCSLLILAGSAGIYAFARDLNALTLGDEDAQRLGANPTAVRRALFFLASVVTAAAVCVSGIVGFVGLVAPHGVRALTGPDHRLLIPISALLGAVLLIGADLAAQLALTPRELPVGVVTALVGGPLFLSILRKRRVVL